MLGLEYLGSALFQLKWAGNKVKWAGVNWVEADGELGW